MQNLDLFTVEDAEKFSIEQIWDLYRKHINASQVELIGTFGAGRDLVEYAEGCYIFLKNGRKILDLTGGIGVLNHGHNNNKILNARRRFQESKKMEVHKNFFSPYTAALSANLARILPGDLNISYFPNSGSEAVEGALKMAYKFHSGKRKVALHSDISFHGKLFGAAGFTGSPELHFKFPTIPGIDKFLYNSIESLKQKVELHKSQDGVSDIYAIIIEPLNASSMRSCDENFLIELRRITREENIVLIFDEVYTGWGKTGWLFNFMRVKNLEPDIVTYAKSFGGGKSSISGYTASNAIARNAYDNPRDATLHSTTYYGFGEEVATAITAVNEIVQGDLVSQSQKIGKEFFKHINPVIEKSNLVKEIRGSGALWGIVFEDHFFETVITKLNDLGALGRFSDPQIGKKIIIGSIISELYDKHGVLTYFGSNKDIPLIISFPLIAKNEEIQSAVKALTDVLFSNLLTTITHFFLKKISGPKSE